jgi:alpha-L-fucosidase
MKKITLFIIVLLGIAQSVFSQSIGGGGEANPNLKTNLKALQNWQEMRLGLFIHWGPVSLRGTEIGWSRGREVPISEYDNLYKEFNPSLFNAKEWVKIAKEAGMKYLIITSKHHDGFCIWNSKYTDYDIMSTPFKRDILKELSDECEKQGILFGTYHSILDWYHPHYTTRYGGDSRPVEQSDMNQYIDYLKDQIKELVQNYGTNILWFDGEWEDSWDHENGMDLYRYVRDLRDDILINNRVDKGRKGMQGMTISKKFAGDFGTPEQVIGAFHPDIPWESCMTICQQWAWKPNDQMKSLKECIQTLAKTAGGGGNLLLNVGPMLDGRIEQRQIDRLKEIGNWLKKNGESIYGTQGGPFIPTSWMASTHKGNKIYLHLFAWPEKLLKLPKFEKVTITTAQILNGAKLNFSTINNDVLIQLPEKQPDENNTVIVLQLDKKASEINPMDVPDDTLISK